jgi:hypothetical protein
MAENVVWFNIVRLWMVLDATIYLSFPWLFGDALGAAIVMCMIAALD